MERNKCLDKIKMPTNKIVVKLANKMLLELNKPSMKSLFFLAGLLATIQFVGMNEAFSQEGKDVFEQIALQKRNESAQLEQNPAPVLPDIVLTVG
jgi:hypothetical protein